MGRIFRACRKLGAVAFALLVLASFNVAAFAQTSGTTGGTYDSGTSDIPSVGVDVKTMLTTTITNVGVIVAVAIGGYFGFLGLRRATRWAKAAFG